MVNVYYLPKDIREVENAYQAYVAFGLNSYQIKDLLVAHKLFTKDLMKESGEI